MHNTTTSTITDRPCLACFTPGTYDESAHGYRCDNPDCANHEFLVAGERQFGNLRDNMWIPVTLGN